MRIAIGQLWQETNTFNPRPTTRRDFEDFGVLRGAELVEKMATTNELGAFISRLRTWPEQPEIVGLVRLPAWPSGLATRDTYDWLEHEMLAALDLLGRLTHAAGVARGDGRRRSARCRGSDLDCDSSSRRSANADRGHARLATNITRAMVEQTQTLVLFHTAPHIDVHETGLRGAAALRVF